MISFKIFCQYRNSYQSDFVIKMKPQILIVMILTAFVGVHCSDWTDRPIKFPLKLLKPDLNAIAQYYETSDKVFFTYLQWPGSIIFRVSQVKNTITQQTLLQIDGVFKKTKTLSLVTKYDTVYYKKETGKFFILQNDIPVPISSDTFLSYEQNYTLTMKPKFTYLSIRYFSLEELADSIEPFYSKYMNYVKNVVTNEPGAFLAKPPNIEGHFVEYAFSSSSSVPPIADGKLQVLLGAVKSGQMHVKENTEAFRLIFNQKYHNCSVLESVEYLSKPLENVFGVRMASVGFMAEVNLRERKSLLLSSRDLISDSDSNSTLQAFLRDILIKVKSVHPRYRFWSDDAPERVEFQMFGHVFVKSVNLKDGRIDKDRPFTVEYATDGREFLYKGRSFTKIYCSDTELWVGN